jgi:hypothetical protein
MGLTGHEKICSFKTKDAARTAGDAFPTGETMAVFNRNAQPGMPADVNILGAVIGTDSALYAAGGFWDNIALSKRFASGAFLFE